MTNNKKVISDPIAVYSESNLSKIGLGKLSAGYNIVNKEDAKMWLQSKRVREATPEEVARYYGKA